MLGSFFVVVISTPFLRGENQPGVDMMSTFPLCFSLKDEHITLLAIWRSSKTLPLR